MQWYRWVRNCNVLAGFERKRQLHSQLLQVRMWYLPKGGIECFRCIYQDKEACVRSFQQWRRGCCQECNGKGAGRINTRFIARTSPFQHCWHVLDILPSLTITYSEPRMKSNFHPSDSCWIVLHSQSHCLHLHFPRNYYPGLNWKWRSSYFSLFPRHFGIWSMTVYLQPDGGQCSTFTLPCSVIWNFVSTVSGHRIRLPTSCFQVHPFLPKAFISILEIRFVGGRRNKALSHHGLIMYPFQEWCLRKVLWVLGELQTSSDIGHQRRVSWGNGTEPGERQELGKKSGRLYMTGLIHSFNTQHTSTEYPLYAKGYSEKRPG